MPISCHGVTGESVIEAPRVEKGGCRVVLEVKGLAKAGY